MSKYLALISLGVGLTLIGFQGSWFQEPPGFSRFKMNPVEMAQTSAFLDGQFRARAFFVEYQERVYEGLASGELTLITACDRLFQFAQEHYPRYVRNLVWRSKKTMKEAMAKNLIDHFRFEAESNPSMLEVVNRLDRQMAGKWFKDWGLQPWDKPAHYERLYPSRPAQPAKK